ncbi:MAG: P27 family phage terminase small subunit [Abyssibacter sp.]|uniref:P27 family phage terminase small subunit n=1 Tax=Abyssibacter sp. TaxID=2320200 RepID=UPI00321BA916
MAGKVGRPAKPGKVHWLAGNPSKKPLNQLTGEFNPDVELAKCPPHLRREARKHYRLIGEELLRYGLVSKLDFGLLSMLAVNWAKWQWAQKRVDDLNAEDEEHGEAGYVATTPNGYKVISVYEQLARTAESSYHKLSAEFGLSPSNRSRVQPGNPQMGLPGMDEPEQPMGSALGDFSA